MNKSFERSKEIAHHIFSGSTTMIGVCVTVITLFRVTNVAMATIADEVLGIDALLFIVSGYISYLSLRRDTHRKLELVADIIFFIAMCIMVMVGFFVVFSVC